jgi:hypothetical protein
LCIGGFPFDDHSLATITQEGLFCTVILFQNMLSLTLLGMMCRRLRCQRDSQREAEIFAASFAEDIPFRNNVSYSCTGARSDNHDSFCTSAHDVQEAGWRRCNSQLTTLPIVKSSLKMTSVL